ncbi:hypothetical protein HY479_00185 [Candidatus Uhrbacteria bacterium]|nr:hypothetical protein [Candidatus Uhrbacteria bacterium]
MKVVALGTGVCANGYVPKADRQPPGFLVDVGGFLVLFDCSEGIRYRLTAAGYDYGRVGHIAVTHGHPDHAALPQFIQAKSCRRIWANDQPSFATCNIYLPRKLAEGFPAVWDWHQPENNGAYWPELTPTFVSMDDKSEQMLAPDIILHSFAVPHGFGKHPALCYRLETPEGVIAYSGDSGMCDALVEAGMDADLYLCEASFRIGFVDAKKYGHLTPREAGEVGKRSRAKRLRLTHYLDLDTPEAMLHDLRESGYHGDADVARDGDVYEI